MQGSMPSYPDNRKVVIRYARKHLLPHAWNFFFILLKNVVGALLYMVPPFLSKYVLETVLPERHWPLLIVIAICMVAAPITGSMMIVWENIAGRFMLRLGGTGRAELYNGLQHRPMEWLLRSRVGDLLTRLLDDTQFITSMANGHLGFTLFHIVTIVAGAFILLALQPPLGAIVLLFWAVQAVLLSRLGRQVKRKAADAARRHSDVAETVRELISGAAFIKAAGREADALKDIRACLHEEWNHTRSGMTAENRVHVLHAALNAFALVTMYVAGGWFVLRGAITVGTLVAFIAVYNWLRPFGASMIERSIESMKLPQAVDRLAGIAFPSPPAKNGLVPPGPLTLETDEVTFHYEERSVIDRISFNVRPGMTLAIVGYRGAGKSTLADLLLGLKPPASGHVRINGIALDEIDPAWLRSSVVCITQDVMLRSGTILDNIAYGFEAATPDAIMEAAAMADLDEWIARLPDGLHTQVGEQALQLSGGERQRISIARALLRKPAILVMDEATSALDHRTESRIMKRIRDHSNGMSIVFITHCLRLAQLSDDIIVLDDGRLKERGTHAELSARPGIYQSLWREYEQRNQASLPLS
ncbi:ABC transporter ATP-binding protein [Paenibacillus lycopersici]|uniref:ABC transporter ATP-binding protein n=1 Tax=Paenibacillus lycopersici TaxID=2704462 RepID=A0A6C0G2B8_9BACL|nr:ABC transporter ATP-binding protein [Paenibacillus lycopersici]QHT61464.1 ABC transporter ATP-binding protein [Paenibacillus lycopersici]